MGRTTYTAEQIINKPREVELFISQGTAAAEASRQVGITEQYDLLTARGNTHRVQDRIFEEYAITKKGGFK